VGGGAAYSVSYVRDALARITEKTETVGSPGQAPRGAHADPAL
jgi:hypothetical protein